MYGDPNQPCDDPFFGIPGSRGQPYDDPFFGIPGSRGQPYDDPFFGIPGSRGHTGEDPFFGIPKPGDPMPPTDPMSLEIALDQSKYPRDRRRAVSYYVEARRAVNSELLRSVDREAFFEGLEAGTEPSRELVGAVVRAFACAAFRLPDARARDGWQRVMSRLRTMLATAMELGHHEARPVVPGAKPMPRIPEVPPVPVWAIMAYEQRRPTPQETEANLAYWKGLPVRLVETVVRAHLNARYRSPDGSTPEGRSRIIGEVRETIWDAVLDAVKRYPCPAPVSTPQGRKPGSKKPPAR